LGSPPPAGEALCPGPTRDRSANGDAPGPGPTRDRSANGDAPGPGSTRGGPASGSADGVGGSSSGSGGRAPLSLTAVAAGATSVPLPAGRDRGSLGGVGRVSMAGIEKPVSPGGAGRGRMAAGSAIPGLVAATGGEKSTPRIGVWVSGRRGSGAAGIPGLVAVTGSEKSIPLLVIGAGDFRGSTVGPAGMSGTRVARAGGADGPPPEVRARAGFGG
jgi:hypothetical protein